MGKNEGTIQIHAGGMCAAGCCQFKSNGFPLCASTLVNLHGQNFYLPHILPRTKSRIH